MFRSQASTYQTRELVARGRSGSVFRAVDSNGDIVALKIHDRADDGHREARRLAAVDHSAVVSLLDQGVTDAGQTWLALPWIDGRTLSDLLAGEAPIDLGRARRLVRQLATAVDALHRVGIVHGDLSPNNVIIGPTDNVTLIDLGASTAPSEIEETTGLDLTVTPRYAAPEVAEGAAAIAASDRYALTLIAYELITGQFPLPSVATPIAMLAHHASTQPVPASEHRPDLPAGVVHALEVGLSKEPSARHPTATDFATALENDRRPARSVGLRMPSVLAKGTASPNRGRLNKRGVAVASLAGLALMAGVSFALLRDTTTSVIAAEVRPWPADRARGLSCNVLTSPGFEVDAVPDHFYGGDPTNLVRLASGLGVDQSTALRLGGPGQFGLFGEIVPTIAGREYVLSVWVQTDGGVNTSGIYVDYLDADFRQLTAARDVIKSGDSISTDERGRATIASTAPQDAVYAVPTFFKDGSEGTLLVDEAVFGLSEACPDLTL